MNHLQLTCKLGPNEIEIVIDPKADELCTVIENKTHYTVVPEDMPGLLASIGMLMKMFDQLPKRETPGFRGVEIPDTLPEGF